MGNTRVGPCPVGALTVQLAGKKLRNEGAIRCYIRDPDGYIIEVGQSTDLKYG
jgi:hypothetical protein